MAHLISLNVELSKLEQLSNEKVYTSKNGRKYVELVIGINDQTNQYGKSVSAWVSQTKEERDSKAAKDYVGNGAVLFTQGEVHKTEKLESSEQTKKQSPEEFPF